MNGSYGLELFPQIAPNFTHGALTNHSLNSLPHETLKFIPSLHGSSLSGIQTIIIERNAILQIKPKQENTVNDFFEINSN